MTGSGSWWRGGEVRLVTAQSLLLTVWANNHGGDPGDSVADVRAARATDHLMAEDRWSRIGAVASDSRTEDEIEMEILAALGHAR